MCICGGGEKENSPPELDQVTLFRVLKPLSARCTFKLFEFQARQGQEPGRLYDIGKYLLVVVDGREFRIPLYRSFVNVSGQEFIFTWQHLEDTEGTPGEGSAMSVHLASATRVSEIQAAVDRECPSAKRISNEGIRTSDTAV
ncbi:uncharacterized protein LOC135822241 [Sycon ciliatum]|uniref:uncharacterized protein LOC135822241 n=1 Tax=Sycon ciliatum TaxID=27933 RepID=UPI0031F67174|eukprot:scpid98407/ scgid8668/ 